MSTGAFLSGQFTPLGVDAAPGLMDATSAQVCGCYTKRPTACAISRSLTPEEGFAGKNYRRTGANSSELLPQTSSLRPCPLLRRGEKVPSKAWEVVKKM